MDLFGFDYMDLLLLLIKSAAKFATEIRESCISRAEGQEATVACAQRSPGAITPDLAHDGDARGPYLQVLRPHARA